MDRADNWIDSADTNATPATVRLNRAGHEALIEEGADLVRSAIDRALGTDAWNFEEVETWPRKSLEFPRVWSLRKDGNELEILAWVAADLHWFEGHFPQQPIVPGVALLHWAGHLAHEWFDHPLGCREVKQTKFQTPVEPETLLRIRLENMREKARVNFTISSTEQTHASGSLQYA